MGHRLRLLGVCDPVIDHLVEMAAQDFLIVQVEVLDVAGLDSNLRGFEGIGVLKGELFEGHGRHFLGDALSDVGGGKKVDVSLEHVGVVRGWPVVVGEIPPLAPEQNDEVGEQLEGVQTPGIASCRIDPRRHVSEVYGVPRTEESATSDSVSIEFDQLGAISQKRTPEVLTSAIWAVYSVVWCLESSLFAPWRNTSRVSCFACRTGAW